MSYTIQYIKFQFEIPKGHITNPELHYKIVLIHIVFDHLM
jgi:hypothetical protein